MTQAALLERVHQHCDEIGECWEWRTQAKTEHSRNHPLMRVSDKMLLVRRVAYEARFGPLAEGRYLRPRCRNLRCVCPEHQLELSALQKNRLGGKSSSKSPTRAASVSRTRRERGLNKLNPDLAILIRQSDEPATTLGPRLNVDDSTVTLVRRGKIWKDHAATPFAGLGSRA